MTEAQLVRLTLEALAIHGIWAFRINSGTFSVDGCPVSGAPAGTPDIHVVGLGWLKAKTARGQLSTSQKIWHAKARKRGVNVGVFRTVREALDLVDDWQSA